MQWLVVSLQEQRAKRRVNAKAIIAGRQNAALRPEERCHLYFGITLNALPSMFAPMALQTHFQLFDWQKHSTASTLSLGRMCQGL